MTLYTKIRPKTFDEVKGQEFTVNNLRMQSIRDILSGNYSGRAVRGRENNTCQDRGHGSKL
mgnify:CR=1 FL=1